MEVELAEVVPPTAGIQNALIFLSEREKRAAIYDLIVVRTIKAFNGVSFTYGELDQQDKSWRPRPVKAAARVVQPPR
jgi:hypothetical protein